MIDNVYAVLTKDGNVIKKIKRISMMLSLVLRKNLLINQVTLNEIYDDVNAIVTSAEMEWLEDVYIHELLSLMPGWKRLPQIIPSPVKAALMSSAMPMTSMLLSLVMEWKRR